MRGISLNNIDKDLSDANLRAEIFADVTEYTKSDTKTYKLKQIKI